MDEHGCENIADVDVVRGSCQEIGWYKGKLVNQGNGLLRNCDPLKDIDEQIEDNDQRVDYWHPMGFYFISERYHRDYTPLSFN